jgi:hypothetical protein
MDSKKLLKWQLNLCESGNAGYHKGQMVDMRKHVNAEPITNPEFIIERIKEKLC